MTKEQAEKMIRNALAQLHIPLGQHQQLQLALDTLVAKDNPSKGSPPAPLPKPLPASTDGRP